MKIINKFIILLIKGYQKLISPLFPRSCRFHPTCSQYACEAFSNFNIFKAFYLSIIRVLKCHPFHPGGFDPISKHKEKQNG